VISNSRSFMNFSVPIILVGDRRMEELEGLDVA
jgi:hypothetical protein